MSKFSKLFAVFLLTSLLLFMGACGKTGNSSESAAETNKPSPSASAEPSKNSEPIKLKLLTISSDDSRQAIMNKFIKPNVGKELPGIEIEYEETADVGAKMKIYNASGDMPDVFWSSSDYAPAIINAGNQLNLKPYITADGYIEKFAVKEALNYKDGIYVLASGADTYFNPRIFYHKDIFEAHNIKVPTTFDELVEASKKLAEAGIQPIATPGKGGWAPGFFLIQNMIQIEDPSVVQDLVANKADFKNPVVKNALNRIVTLAKAGAFGQGAANLDYGPAKELFTQNKAAMYMMFSWELPDLEANVKDLDFFPWPAAGDKYDVNNVVQFWGSPLAGYAVSAKSEHLEEAVKLAEFLNKQDALYFTGTGSLVSFDTGTAPNPQPLQKKNIDSYHQAGIKIPSLYVTMDAKTAAEFTNLGSLLMTGQYTADEFIKDFNDKWLANTYFD